MPRGVPFIFIEFIGSSAVVNLGEYTNEGETKKVAVKTLNCCRADVIKEIEALSSCKHDNVIAFIGSSAVVNLGEYTNEGETIKVAVKTLNCCRADVIKEIEALSSCKHDNVIAFIGWMEIDDEMKIITEYLSGGDLHSYLTNPNKILKISTIFSYIFQVLDAMIFMSHKHIIHRDLSARNCLLDETFECLKISDFGLARLTNVDYEYLPETNRPLPFRWLPLEAFKGGNFSVKGDIWSIGILIWELFERGACPYKNLFYPEVVEYLASGKRLVRPEQCPKQLYTVMSECWNENPINRPTFDAIKEDIKAVYSYLKLYEPEKLNMIIEVTGVEISSASN
uniref:Protein kinase domain-containing protein n=1 Tax=Panagrolaimus sp. ES5 TaxID=591445 RepID=A0AC34FGZ6_9BILA